MHILKKSVRVIVVFFAVISSVMYVFAEEKITEM